MSAYLIAVILSYSGLGATTYGWGEMYCGPPDTPQECSPGSPTASGALLDPFARPQVAIALKAKTRLRSGLTIQARLPGGKCTTLELVDKKAPRFFQSDSPWDLTPAALFALGAVSPNPTWSGRLEICSAPSF